MNIIEATEAMDEGKLVRRPEYSPDVFYFMKDGTIYYFDASENIGKKMNLSPDFVFTVDDIFATDWEISEIKRELTWNQIEQVMIVYFGRNEFSVLSHKIKKDLGFP